MALVMATKVQKLVDGQKTLSQDIVSMIQKLTVLGSDVQQLNAAKQEMKSIL